jgi:protein-disulfide isomerase
MPRMFRIFAFALMAAFGLQGTTSAAELSPAERAAFEAVIKDYLLKNPEIIEQAIEALQKKKEDAARLARLRIVEDKAGPLFNSKTHVVIGSPSAPVTLVEFFDYNCGYCKKALPDMAKLVESEPAVKIILKDFPILSRESQEAAIVAMALKQQFEPKRFWDFHLKLMSERGRIGKEQAIDLAREMGADMDRLANDMTSDLIRAGLSETAELAQALDISGTPSYVLGDEVVVGAVGIEELQSRISAIKQCGKNVC